MATNCPVLALHSVWLDLAMRRSLRPWVAFRRIGSSRGMRWLGRPTGVWWRSPLRSRLGGRTRLIELDSIFGHDAFLNEGVALQPIIEQALTEAA